MVNHLADEGLEDFRARLRVVTDGRSEFAAIDPGGWVERRRYADRDVGESLERFRLERLRCLEWLRTLDPSRLAAVTHARLGEVTGWQIHASWAAQDLLHVKQISRVRYDRLVEHMAPLSPVCAGAWT